MASFTSTDTLIQACRTLFGHDFTVSRDLISRITPADLNLAFSKQLKMKMPDKATVKSLSKTFIAEQLRDVTLAYKTLLTLFVDLLTDEDRAEATSLLSALTSKDKVMLVEGLIPPPVPPQARDVQPGKLGGTAYYQGTLPHTKLRFATFLYYKGVIDQKTLAAALEWQKKHRPLIGQIALAWDFIDLREFAEFLYRSKDGVPFGQIAKRRGRLSDKQIAALLTEQERFRLPIGQFFIKNKSLTKAEVEMYLLELDAHNSRYT